MSFDKHLRMIWLKYNDLFRLRENDYRESEGKDSGVIAVRLVDQINYVIQCFGGISSFDQKAFCNISEGGIFCVEFTIILVTQAM